jgi:hypothetical protein
MSRSSTGGWIVAKQTTGRRAGGAMAPRTGRALAASLALAAIGMPAALLASQASAAAAAGKGSAESQVSVAITGMTPQAGPGITITVSGTVTNSSRQPISNLSVQLLASRTPVSSSAELRPGSTEQTGLASTPVPRGVWKSGSELQPGSTAPWRVQVKANSIGMTRFGVYPLTAQAQTTSALEPLAATSTYLPYVPAKKGPYGSSIPAQTKIAWVMPLIDKPLLGPPWQGKGSCQGPQAQALAASLRSNGRLGQLLAAGAHSTGTVEIYSAAAGSARSARSGAVRSEQAQSLSGYDGVTWAVDPALLANVRALAGCGSTQPRWASAAHSWLTELRRVTAAEPIFLTPYADPDVAALANTRLASDVGESIGLGQQIGQQILHRNVGSTSATASLSSAQSQAASIAWPAGGIGNSTGTLAAHGVRTLLLSQSALPAEQSTVFRIDNNIGGFLHVLLANAPLTRLLAARGSTATDSTAGSTFAAAQDFLAQTALAAEQGQPGAPLIVAPPQRWDPATGLAAELLAETASAPWLSPASLTSLTAGKSIPLVLQPHWAGSPAPIGKHQLRGLTHADHGVHALDKMAARPNINNNLFLAVATIESSAWRGKASRTARAMLATVLSQIAKQEHAVQIFAEPKVTLGGLKGSVPVSIDNGLDYAVKVQLQVQSQSPGVKVIPAPSGVVTVPAHNSLTVRLHVQATQVGSTTVTMSLLNKAGQRVVPAASMTIEATQVGVLFVIICAAALGVYLIAYAARVVRRGHPAGDAGDPPENGSAADQGGDHSTDPAEPDTVMTERTELGTAGAPGP